MILAILVFNCNLHLIRMAVILEFVNMAVPCGARQKSKQYDIDDLWDKFDAFGGI